MKRMRFAVLFGLALLITGCFFPVRSTRVIGSGNIIDETRRVSGISAVELNGIGTLVIEQGDTESLEISAEDNVIGYLQSEMRGNKLVLSIQDFIAIDPREEIVYTLHVTELVRVETNGLGSVEIGRLETEDFDLVISGSGNVEILDLQAADFSLDVSGLGNITIAGKVEAQRVDLSGAGNYNAGDLYSDDARVEISGTGRAIVWAENELDVELSGMGTLKYYGSPTLRSEMSGAGSVESLGPK